MAAAAVWFRPGGLVVVIRIRDLFVAGTLLPEAVEGEGAGELRERALEFGPLRPVVVELPPEDGYERDYKEGGVYVCDKEGTRVGVVCEESLGRVSG